MLNCIWLLKRAAGLRLVARGEKGCGKEVGAPPVPQGLWVRVSLGPFPPGCLHPGGFAEHNRAVVHIVQLHAGSSFCLSFYCAIRSLYREVWITREKAKKIPRSKNKAKQGGVKHKLARAKGLALILLLTFVFIQRLWIQVNFLCSIFIGTLLVLNWNNEHFVDWVKRLSHFIQPPAPLSVSAGFKQFILISDF